MAINPTKLNFLGAAATQAQQPISPTQAVGKGLPNAEAENNSKSNNPFNAKSNYGVGLVNSDLSGMSYKLPNGKNSTCNTIGVG